MNRSEPVLAAVRARLGTAALLASAALASGCAALHIDVDVYKGPLVNSEDLQRDQLVALVMSAKPLMYSARNKLLQETKDAVCTGLEPAELARRSLCKARITSNVLSVCTWSSIRAQAVQAARPTEPTYDDTTQTPHRDETAAEKASKAQQLDALLRFYEDLATLRTLDRSCADLQVQGSDNGRTERGIDTLARVYAAEREACGAVADKPDRKTSPECMTARTAFAQLDHLFVDLAGRMQFLANALWLIGDPQADDDERYKSTLQTIANSIVVHADDLRRQRLHQDEQQRQAKADRAAMTAAFAADPAKLYSQIEDALLKMHNSASGAHEAQLRTLEEALGTDRTAAAEALRKAKASRDAWLAAEALALTLGVGKVDLAAAELSREPPADWRTDQDTLGRHLLRDKLALVPEALGAEVEAWLDEQIERARKLPAFESDPRLQRLQRARTFVPRLKPVVQGKALTRRLALDRWRAAIGKARANLAAEAQGNEQTSTDAAAREALGLGLLNRVRREADAAAKAQQLPFDKSRFPAAQQALKAVRADVLTALADAKVEPDTRALTGFLRASLLKAKAAANAGSGPADALLALDAVTVPDALGTGVGKDKEHSIHVQDELVARLRFDWLASVRTKGVEHADSKNAEAALALARKQRDDLLYVRPTQSYLRSVYAATYTQSDPQLSWKNLLWAQFQQQFARDKKNRATIENDKANWQTINTIKVSGAGDTNFVVAKDDVGNWYVKAMGVDGAAMVKAARSLALYNLGGRFDANLLRVDDLRQAIPQETDKDRRDEMRQELSGLTDTHSGAAVTARRRTLELFTQNYEEQSKAHAGVLAGDLGSGKLRRAIEARWEQALEPTSQPKLLATAFDDPAVAQALADAKATLDLETSKQPVGKAVLAALRALQRTAASLKAAVAREPGLTSKEFLDKEKARTDAAGAREAMNKANSDLATAVKAKSDAQSAVTAAQGKPEPAPSTAQAGLTRAIEALSSAQEQHGASFSKLEAADKSLADAVKALTAAESRRTACLGAIETLVQAEVGRIAADRLKLVGETETAVKVIGRSTP